MKIVLAGNPNAGKTTLFNALTGSRLKTGNWHGVTTSAFSKTVDGITFVDVPGAYSTSAFTMEEKEAINEIKSADIIVNVVDSLTLENSLEFTNWLLSLGVRAVVYLTKTEKLKKRGGWVDIKKLSAILGAPVCDMPPKQLKSVLLSGKIPKAARREMPLNEAYYAGNLRLTPFERLILNKYFSLAFFVFFIIAMFFIAFYPTMPGAVLKDMCEALICERLGGWLKLKIENPVLSSFVCEGLIGGAGGVISFIPQLTVLYLFLTLLDESGIMSALSFVTDGLFERVNLSGRAAFSLISGFGCTAAAIATTRGFTSDKSQKRTVAALPFVPCGAKLPVFLTFLSPVFKDPFIPICILYFAGLALSVLCCKLSGKGGEELLSEVAPIGAPDLKPVAIKLYFYLKGFIIKVATAVTAFCAVSWVLSHFSFTFAYCETEGSMLCSISKAICPLFYPMGISDWRIAYAALTGFIAKENVAATIGMLMPEGLNLALAPTLAMCAFILACPACVSAFAASVRECGLKFTLKCFVLQLLAAFAAGYVIYFIVNLFV